MTTPPTPDQPGKTGQPANPFSQPRNAQGPVYGQQPPPSGQQPPVYGQPQVYGQQPQPGYAPIPGAPGGPTPPPPSGIHSNKIIPIVIGVVAVVVLAAVVIGYFVFRDGGRSVDSTAIGSCITVESEGTTKVDTKSVDCGDTSALSFVVASKLSSEQACESAGLRFWVTEYGEGASDEVLCLMPNYVQGNCYEESTISQGIGLEEVPCSEKSTMMSVVYKVTERVDSASVPNCTDKDKQQIYTATIESDPRRPLGVCAVIQGDYTWQE